MSDRGSTNSPTPSVQRDPVLFGPDPFADQPGRDDPHDETLYRRPRWPAVAIIMIMVMILVGGMGLWVF